MRTPRFTFIAALLLPILLVMLVASPAAAQSAGRPDNYYGAGKRVEIATPMAGDVIAAGREIVIKQPVAGDILAAGWHVELAGRADDDVRVAGSQVDINAPVAGDLTIAGGSITVGPHAQVSGRSWITGQTVRIDGVLERELEVAAAEVVIAGEVRKPVRIIAEKLDILPGAQVLAGLTYRGPREAAIAKDATVTGPITFTRIDARDAQRERGPRAVATLLFVTQVFLAGLLVIVFMPRIERSVVATLRARPLPSFLAGGTLLVTVPIVALVLILTLFALPLGLMLAALYAVALFAGVLTTAFFLGDAEARWLKPPAQITRGREALVLLAGVVTLAVLRTMFGGVAMFVAILFGLGALSVSLYQMYIGPSHAPATA
jgi:hypothetical protein